VTGRQRSREAAARFVDDCDTGRLPGHRTLVPERPAAEAAGRGSPAAAGTRCGWGRAAPLSSPTPRCAIDAGRPTVRTWLFSVEQAVLLDNWDPIGLRGTASESYRVDDLFVPEDISGPSEDPSLRGEQGPLCAFPRHALYSVGNASVGLGIARGVLDTFVELTSRKTPRGAGRLADNAVIQAELARSEARLGGARGLPTRLGDRDLPTDRSHGPNRRDGPSAGAPRRLPYNNGRRRGRHWTYKPPWPTQSSLAATWSAAFATSIHCRRRSSRATRIMKLSARYRSAPRPRCFLAASRRFRSRYSNWLLLP